MYQYQYNQPSQHSQFANSSYEAGQLRSMSSMSTMNSETDSNTFQHSSSSAQTSTNSSPYNYHKLQQQLGELQQPSIHEENEGVGHENSPDLMKTEFYSSDNTDHKVHTQNFRQSMVFSDSMDSQKFQSVRDSIYMDPATQEPTKLAMTNSPSFSALAQILEKKTKFKPSIVTSTIHEDEDVFTNPSNSQSLETLTLPASTPSQQAENTFRYTNNFQQETPNLIQLDDTETDIQRYVSHDSILPSPMDPDSLVAPQFYERMNQQQKQNPQPQNFYADDDIFKTPEVPQISGFKKEAPKEPSQKYASMLDFVDEFVVPDIFPNPARNQIVHESPRKISEDFERSTLQSQNSQQSQISEEEFDSSKPLPKLRLNTGLASPQYKQRSSSLPVLNLKQPVDGKTSKEPKKRNRFISLFKSKRSISTSQVEQIKEVKQAKESRENESKSSLKPATHENNSPQLPPTPRIAKKSTSSTSLFDAFKRKNKSASKSFSDIPNIQINNQNHTFTNNNRFSSSTNDIIRQLENDDSLSISTLESTEFNEDFNTLSVDNHRPISQISNSGGDVFPKSLNRQEIESIVSIERNRSVRSRHSTMSLSDAISLNAQEEGMYVTQGDRDPSIPDLHKSPTNSVLKKQNSISSLKIDDELEFGGDISTELEFDSITDNYVPDHLSNNHGEDEEEDPSRFMEFADFIDFGGDLELNFDFEPESNEGSSPKRTLRPSNPVPKLQPPLSAKPFNPPQSGISISSPLLESPILHNEPFQNPSHSFHQRGNSITSSISTSSPALQPLPQFIQEQASRPISMSFKGLRAPAFVNHKNALTSSSSFASQNSSSKTSLNKRNIKVSFSSKIVLYDAWHADDYDRHPDVATCNQLTPLIAQQIKDELNELKREMEVHEESQCYTHFY